jgi:hypothetical protein
MGDLNYLFHRQQQERDRSERAPSPEARMAHEQLAKFYEERISRLTKGRINIARFFDDVDSLPS